MFYSETYNNLFKKYPFNNFEIIAEAMETYFSDLFQLDALDNKFKKGGVNGSYAQFFDWCVNQLKELHTTEEVVVKLNSILNGPMIENKLLNQFTFVPSIGNKKSKQIAYFEKLAVGDLNVAEPLSVLDMKRVVLGLNNLLHKNGKPTHSVQVVHLKHFVFFDPLMIDKLKNRNKALLINLNKDLKALPKWGVLDLTHQPNPRIYCETALSESEKELLEKALHLKDIHYEGGNTNSLLSSGYTALAWLDNNITKAWNFDGSADFPTLQEAFRLSYSGGDAPGLEFSFTGDELNDFCTPAFRDVLKITTFDTKENDEATSVTPGFIINRLSWISNLGQFEGEKFSQSDLSTVVRIAGTKNMQWKDIEPGTFESKRLTPPRFSATLAAHPGLLDETSVVINSIRKSRVQLIVPEEIDITELGETHERECQKTQTSSDWFTRLPNKIKRPGGDEEFYATMMVLTLVRSRAKKSIIHINLPERFQLNRKEIDFIVDSLANNPFVTEFEINKNSSLSTIKEQLIPILARNRWLQENNYRPPFVGNYWKEAAKYWVTYLHEHQNILEPGEQHSVFKRCAIEMGIKGLDEVLNLLKDDSEREIIERIYGKDKPAFFAACESKDYAPYLERLVKHIQGNLYFPYRELGVSYQPGNNSALIKLIAVINKLDKFEKISLTDCLEHSSYCHKLLKELIENAKRDLWTGLIVIPELEDKSNVSDDFQSLRMHYTLLNDLILKNRHIQLSRALNKSIKEASHFILGEKPDSQSVAADNNKPMTSFSDEAKQVISSLDTKQSWPLKKGGVVQLQLQQQQQIEQSRQIQQEQQKVVINTVEDPLHGDLVDYHNISKVLGTHFRNYIKENSLFESAVSLWKKDRETLLQGLFHTWINANPTVNAFDVIKKMTPAAAKSLLLKHPRLASGLNPDNLPKGFYTQRSKDDELILCYSPELAYINPPNPMTLDLDVRVPIVQQWKGDFRQIELDRYTQAFKTELDEIDWQNIAFFVQLQSSKADYSEDYYQFLAANPERSRGFSGLLSADPIKTHKDKIIAHWPVFLQVWQYAGMSGVKQFIATDEKNFKISPGLVQNILFEKQPENIRSWTKTIHTTEDTLRALGQIYYLHGHESLSLFLTKLKQIEDTLGNEFFEVFYKNVICKSANFNCFMELGFFTSMDKMMEKLSPAKAIGNKKVWQAIFVNHMKTAGWDNIEALWRGFDYFVNELNGLDLALVGDEFNKLPPQNMLVCMDRILASLKQIPDQQEKIRYLSTMCTLDLTHGGVHYALQHEGFKHFDSSLELYNFHQGLGDTPHATYATNLKEIFDWNDTESVLKMKRAVASQSQFNHEGFEVLVERLGNEQLVSREHLLWLLHTQYSSLGGISAVLDNIQSIPADFKSQIARHLHRAVYELGNKQLGIQLEAMHLLAHFNFDANLLDKYPNGTMLEAVSILYQANRWDAQKEQLMRLMQANLPQNPDCPEFVTLNSYKLAALFGALTQQQLLELLTVSVNIKPVVQNSLRLLIKQLLSLDYEKSDLAVLQNPLNWTELLACIQEMKKDPSQTAKHRIAFVDRLNQRGLEFKYSKTGEFRALQSRAIDGPAELSSFVDHDERLWNFLHGHIVVPTIGDATEALKPMMIFFKQLQLNRTYLNEIEPLLSSLEETPLAHYWSANYFQEMLKALQPDSDDISFPISLLKVMLKEMAISAKPINSVQNKFPKELVAPIQNILKNRLFNRNQQAILCQIALREYDWNGRVELLNRIIATLSSDAYQASRDHALNILAKTKNFKDLESQFENCCWLLQHPSAADFKGTWTQTSGLWLKAIGSNADLEQLFTKIKNDNWDKRKQSLILHIFANSTLSIGLSKMDISEYQLNRKSIKLVDTLSLLQVKELEEIAQCYSKDPSPGTDDLLRIIKKFRSGERLDACFDQWLRTPYPEPRADYASVAATREADLQRMIFNTKVTGEHSKASLSAKDAVRVTLIFATIKQLECGELLVAGAKQPIAKMSQSELAKAFKDLSQESVANPDNDELRAQIWAIMFEVLGRTTRKYPHLAQQFALVAKDVCVTTGSPHVLQLATGEGKSHFVAMRAARNAGIGKVVDVCTAKRTLAQRDLLDYKNFFDYLDLKTAFIHSKSERDTYINADIHYSTIGDLSLFIDEQSYAGTPIDIHRENRVALFDEFDFIRFEEGRKTEYNYARPTGKTPKQMTWFYQAINEYYRKTRKSLNEDGINHKALEGLIRHLVDKAGDHEDHHNLVSAIIRDKLQLVQWLQSAHEAHELQWGGENGFTVRDVNIEVGDETYPMREIIPLSSDNQPMFGSTFSVGVHQLLAVRLNTEAKALPESAGARKRAQNFHIHPESNIISSQVAAQRMKQLYGAWEGFSGTISAAQATTLYNEQGTEVLHVPTNQNDLRLWHKPGFYLNEKTRRDALVKQLRVCLDKKQSILFSCKNDAQVKQLEEYLKTQLTSNELAQLIFYTNEEERTPVEVLQDKQDKEQWQGGKKQQAMGLVASGFGRGDNVGVEAVFLFDVNDNNDKLQKGGRTARNGEEGEVFQFYLSNDLLIEEKRLWDSLELLAPGASAGIKTGFQEGKLNPDSIDPELCFERVMLLREHVFTMQNEANQGYRNAISQLSSWGMEHLGQIADIQFRQELSLNFSYMLKRLAKNWIDISSQDKTTINDKIKQIEDVISSQAMEFAARYNDLVKTDISSLMLDRHHDTQLDIQVPQAIAKPTKRERTISDICRVLMRLENIGANYEKVSGFPQQINLIAESIDQNDLYRFAKEVVSCSRVEEFEQKLLFALDHVTKPSKEWTIALAATEFNSALGDTLREVNEPLRVRLYEVMQGLRSELQSQVVKKLQEIDIRDVVTRIQTIIPLLEYVAKFSYAEQERLGEEYIANLDVLVQEMPHSLLLSRMRNSKPMPYSNFYALWRMANNVEGQASSLNYVMEQLEKSIEGSTDQRLRMLTIFESWSNRMNKEDAKPFMLDFSSVMSRFKEGVDWDVFKALVNQTQNWWNVNEDAHKPQLIALWKQLSEQGEKITELKDFIRWNLQLGGKSWYQNFQIGVERLQPRLLSFHVAEFNKFWMHLDTLQLKKDTKTTRFGECCTSLNVFYQSIAKLPLADRNQLILLLKGLDGERFTQMMQFVHEHPQLMLDQPLILKSMLGYISNVKRSISCVTLLGEALLLAGKHQELHPHVDIARLIEGVARYQDKDESVLKQLIILFRPEITAQPLFDVAAEYIAKRMAHKPQDKVVSMMHTFYEVVAKAKGDISAMLTSDKLSPLFQWADDETKQMRDDRIILMHLLHRRVFEGGWGKFKNDAMMQACFKLYTEHMESTLRQSRATSERDLNIAQQNELLQLTDEFKAIGTQLQGWDDQQWNGLANDLSLLTREYQSSWFKSSSRHEISRQLQQQVDHILYSARFVDNRYQSVLTALHDAKLSIMKDDMRENESRLFKLHRNGHSRLYTTIIKMQDAVLRHWAQDMNAVGGMRSYDEFNRVEFIDMTAKLQQAFSKYWTEQYDKTQPGYNDKSRTIGRFFSRASTEMKMNRLKDVLNAFVLKHPTYGIVAPELSLDEVSNLIIELQADASPLPGHLRVLVNDIMVRADSLRDHLMSQPTYNAVNAILGDRF